MNRIVRHVRGNAVAYVALFVAMGGTSYAAANLPANSVGARQLINHSITAVKFDPRYISGSVRAWAAVDANGKILESSTRARVVSSIDFPGVYRVDFDVPSTARCTALAGVDNRTVQEGAGAPGLALANVGSHRTTHAMVSVNTYSLQGSRTSLPFDLVLFC